MKTKVLIFQPEITENGVSKILSDFILNFSDNIKCEILTFRVTDDIYLPPNITIHSIGHTKNIFKRIYSEFKIMKSFDVVHINGNYISRIIECFSAKISKVKKIIVHSHNNGYENNSKLKILCHNKFKWLFNFFATDYIACSKLAATWMFSKQIINKNKFKVINNGIEIEKFKFNEKMRNRLRKKYKLEDKFVIGNIGRFVYQKNHEFLIEIFRECKKQNQKCALVLIGSGPLKDEIIKKAENDNDILFLESTNKIYDFYNMMDCFVLPSRYEGLGIVNIEAQANGINTFVSDQVPKEAKVSKLIKYISLNKLASYWAKQILKENKNDRENAYKEVIKNKYDIKSATKELEDVYLNK